MSSRAIRGQQGSTRRQRSRLQGEQPSHSLGHGAGYHEMFTQWEENVGKILEHLRLDPNIHIHVDSRASVWSNLSLIQLASLNHEGTVEIITDAPKSTREFGFANHFVQGVKRGLPPNAKPPVDIRVAPNGLGSELRKKGKIFYAGHEPLDAGQACAMIQNVASESMLVLDLNTLKQVQDEPDEPTGRVARLANELQQAAQAQGKRVVLLHGLDPRNAMEQPILALYSARLKEVEARIHAPLAGALPIIEDAVRRLKDPSLKSRSFESVRANAYEKKVEEHLNAARPKAPALQASDDFALVHTRAGFGGDQLSLSAGLLHHLLATWAQGQKFKKMPMVLHVPNYWRVEREAAGSANVDMQPVVADTFLNRNHEEFLDRVRQNRFGLVYVDNPTNPQGRKHTEKSMTEILLAAKHSQSMVVDDLTLVNPHETPKKRLEYLHRMVSLANEYSVPYLAIVSGSKYVEKPGIKIGAVLASRQAARFVRPFRMPVTREEAELFDRFANSGLRGDEEKVKSHMRKAYGWMKEFAGRRHTLHQLIDAPQRHLLGPHVSSFKVLKLHLPPGKTVSDLMSEFPQLKEFDPKALQGLGTGPYSGMPKEDWDAWGSMYRISPVSHAPTMAGIRAIEKAAWKMWENAGYARKDVRKMLKKEKPLLQAKAQAAAAALK